MSIDSDIFDGLTGYAALKALIDTRLFPEEMPPDIDMPAIVYTEISRPADNTFGRNVVAHTPRYGFRCWAELPETEMPPGTIGAKDVRTEVENALLALAASTVTINAIVIAGGESGQDAEKDRYFSDLDAQILYQD